MNQSVRRVSKAKPTTGSALRLITTRAIRAVIAKVIRLNKTPPPMRK